jgi:hypothetical protein
VLVPLPTATNRRAARTKALFVADALGSKVVSHRGLTVGEPHCPYRVPFHCGDFWFSIYVAESAYVFAGEHRRREAFAAGFSVAIKRPNKTMLLDTRMPSLSHTLGCDVYMDRDSPKAEAERVLLGPSVREIFRRTDLGPVQMFFLNSIQIRVICDFFDDTRAFAQIPLLRQLLLTVFEQSHPDT